jgi:hypothetical protein
MACALVATPDAGYQARCIDAPGPGEPCPDGRCGGRLHCMAEVDGGRCEPTFCLPRSFWVCDVD